MALENDPSSRMQLLSLGELQHPGQCCVCGNGNSEKSYVSLGVFYDYEGHMYLCGECVVQSAETFGMFTGEDHQKLMAVSNTALELNSRLTEELSDVYEQLVAARLLLRNDSIVPDVISNVDGLATEEPDSGAGIADSEPVSYSGPAEPAVSGEPEVKEPVTGSGRSNTSGTKSGNRKFT